MKTFTHPDPEEDLHICPHASWDNCNHRFISGKICGHHIPHKFTGSVCEAYYCGENKDCVCKTVNSLRGRGTHI